MHPYLTHNIVLAPTWAADGFWKSLKVERWWVGALLQDVVAHNLVNVVGGHAGPHQAPGQVQRGSGQLTRRTDLGTTKGNDTYPAVLARFWNDVNFAALGHLMFQRWKSWITGYGSCLEKKKNFFFTAAHSTTLWKKVRKLNTLLKIRKRFDYNYCTL